MKLKMFFLTILILISLIVGFFFIAKPPKVEKVNWGVNFSQKHSELLGLNWRENYLALLDDLKVKNIKILTHWDLIEPQKDEYFFDDLNWQISETEKRDGKIILVIGMKTGRWPECHIPQWTKNLSKEEQQKEILELLEKIITTYRGYSSVIMWQVENEALFPFGECPWIDKNFLRKEIDLVKSLDKRPVIISDSGEFSFWFTAAKMGDIIGTTLHRKAWFKELKRYISYPFNPAYYWRRAQLIKRIFNKKVMVVELQSEPWGPGKLIYDTSLEEQKRTMNLEQFKKNIEFAKNTGLNTFYLWGAEWWYWLKEKQNQPEIWQEAKKLFHEEQFSAD